MIETPDARAERERAERLAILREIQDDWKDVPISSDDFIEEKQREIERELEQERRWENRNA